MSAKGFTLIEILVAIFLASFIAILVLSGLSTSLSMNEKTLNLLDKKMNLSSNNLCIIIKNLCKELIKYNKI